MINNKRSTNFKLQIRSFRLKPATNNIILFPDYCILTFNNKDIK